MLPAIIAIPLLSAAVVGLFRNSWSKTTISWVASGSVGISFAMVLALFYNFTQTHEAITAPLTTWGPMLNFGLLADALSLWWMLVVTGCGFLIHVYSTGYMRDDESFGRFMAKMNFFIFAMSLLVLSDNFAGLVMGWANVGLASYLLIGFYIKKPAAMSAAIKAFVMNSLGEVGLVAGVAYIYKTFGTLSYHEVFKAIGEGKGLAALNLIGILLLIGAIAKSAQLPLHTWLPYAMEGPTPVSALIHAATMVTAGVYLVSRAYPIYHNAETAAMFVAWIGALGALFGAVVAAGQNDIKRVLAFSTLSQIGYMFLGNGLGAYTAADFHFLTHAFFKAALFLCAGIVVHHYNGDQDIRKMGGLWKEDKFAVWTFGIGALALIGIFPFAGFFSKDEILAAALNSQQYALFAIAMLAAGMTAFYNVRLFSLVFLGTPHMAHAKDLKKAHRPVAVAAAHGHDAQGHDAHGHDAHGHAHATPAAMTWSVGILAVLSVVGGLIAYPGWQVGFLKSSFELLGELEHEGINWAVAGSAMGLALIFGGISYYLYGPNGVRRDAERNLAAKPGILVNMFYFDAIYDALIVNPVLAVGDFCANIGDAKLIDGAVDGLGKLSAGIGSGLRALNSGYVRKYALTVFAGVAIMLVYFIFMQV
jgi:NADH-quinone oxidoreductase subunit L